MNTSAFTSTGYHLNDGYLSPEECRSLIERIAVYRQQNVLPEIHRPTKGRSLRYFVIDGEKIQPNLTRIWDLYNGSVKQLVNELTHTSLEPLANLRAGVNVNIMPAGRSEYRWHYDRTRVTAVLYLNKVEGGETELYPNYRILLENHNHTRLQQLLDRTLQLSAVQRVFAKKIVIEPRPGRLLVMRANRCWHSVRAVRGSSERINIILAYDRPGAEFPVERGLDAYLYTRESTVAGDPNYVGR